MAKGMDTRHSQKNIQFREMCLSKASELGMGVVAMKVYGAMAFGHNAKNLVPEFDAGARAKLPGACLRYVLDDPRIDILNVGMSFVEDIDKFYDETKERGLRFNNPPATLADDHGNLQRKALYAQDPDGNWLEFVETF